MEVTESDIYGQAIGKAKAELSSLTVEFEALSKRKAQLEAFIANAEPLVPKSPAPLIKLGSEVAPFLAVKPVPIWRSIINSINGKAEGFSVRDAIEALDRIGRPVDSPNAFQIVRNVLKKKTENFELVSAGLFRVKTTETKKEAPIPETS